MSDRRRAGVRDSDAAGAEFMLRHRVHRRSHDLARDSKPGRRRFGFPLMYQTNVLEILRILTRLGNRDGLLVRYTPSGAVKWWRVFDGAEHGDDWFNVVALWGKSSLFAGGVTTTAADTGDVLAARYTR